MTDLKDALKLDTTLEKARYAASLGRKVLLDYFGQLKSVNTKEKAGLVTEADLTSEKEITGFLSKEFPQYDILGEEQSYIEGVKASPSAEAQGRWIIDPLDGTTNYVHQFPIFCISIGLEVNREVVVGVIDVPLLNTTYYGFKGGGAFVSTGENSVIQSDQVRKLGVSSRSEIKDCLLATGFFTPNNETLESQLCVFNHIIKNTRGIRRAGSAAYDLCMVADGVFDGFWESGLSSWDTAAGSLLVKEAGGVVTNYSGSDFHVDMESVLAANSQVHKKIQGFIGEALRPLP